MASAPDLPPNRLNALLAKLDRLPRSLRLRAFDLAFGRFTPFYRTMGVRAVELQPDRVTLAIRDRRATRNHVGSIHALAAMLPAEYAAGLLIGRHVPEGRVVVVGSIRIDLHKAYRGDMRATATLPPDLSLMIREESKGGADVPVSVQDEGGLEVMTGSIRMAWFEPRRRD